MNRAAWARVQGVHRQAAYRWFREGTLPVPRCEVNQRTLLVSPEVPASSEQPAAFGLYEDPDRLGRVNAELVESALAAHGRRLVVLDGGGVDDDLVREMVEVLMSFCARLYGRRSARNRALKAVGCARRGIGPAAVVGGAGQDAV